MTVEEQEKIAQDAMYRFYCVDDETNKAHALKANEIASPEARRILREAIYVDGCGFWLEEYNWMLEEAGVTAVNLTVPLVLDGLGEAVRRVLWTYDTVRRNREHLMLAFTPADIRRAKKEGKFAAILGAQSCRFLEDEDLESACEIAAKMGMRVIQIGYNGRTFATDGAYTGTDCGISAAGKQLIRSMEKAGMTVDLSHVGIRSSLEAMDCAAKPCIFSHSNPIALFNHPRNITDEQAKKCAKTGGVVGVVAWAPLLWNHQHLPCVEDYIDAIAYYADLIGIEHVGIGTDTQCQPAAYDRREARYLQLLEPPCRDVFLAMAEGGYGTRSAYPEGLYNMCNMPNVVERMLRRGFKEAEIKLVLGENFLRVFEKTWRTWP